MRVLVADTLTNTLLGELAPSGMSFNEALNAPGACTLEVPLSSWRALGNLAPLTTCIYVDDDTVTPRRIAYTGPVWSVELDKASSTARLSSAGWWSLVRRRILRSDLTYTATDQATIALGLLAAAQTGTNRNLLLNTSTVTATGVARDRTYAAADRKNLGEAIEQLAAVNNGFDFTITGYWNGNTPGRRFNLLYPNTGAATALTFSDGANCTIAKLNRNATGILTDVDVIGSTVNNTRLIETRTQTLAGVPDIDATLSASDVTVTATLQAHGDRALRRGSAVAELPAVTLQTGARQGYDLGNIVRFVSADLGLNAQYRIVGRAVTTSGKQLQETLTLSPVALF